MLLLKTEYTLWGVNMINFSNLIYLPVDVPNPPKGAVEFFDTIDYKDMIVDTYRTCHHIPIMDKDGTFSSEAKEVKGLVEWFENEIFTWSMPARMRIITTPPGGHNACHIDCSPDRIGTWQHKFRYVFQGDRTTLIFNNKEEDVRIHDVDKCYIMDGAWPHEMLNTTNKRKYTLTLGAPWEPQSDDKKYVEVLQRSYNEYKNYYISSEKWQLPENWKSLFQPEYDDQLYLLENYNGA